MIEMCECSLVISKVALWGLLLFGIAHSCYFCFVCFSHNPVYQERYDLDTQGHLSDWSREGEERT